MILNDISVSLPSPSLLVTLTCGILGGWWLYYYLFDVRTKRSVVSYDKDDTRPPEVPNMSALQFMIQLISKDGPPFVLNLARQMNTFCYRLPGTKTFEAYIIADPLVARKILEHPQTTKPYFFYSFFEQISTGPSFFVQNGHRSHHVRKATAAAFSKTNIQGRTTHIIESIVERWVQQRLEPYLSTQDTTTTIDIDQEMISITTDVIFQVGFGYTMSMEERNQFVEHLNFAMNEFFLNFKFWRAWPLTAWMFPGVRKAWHAADAIFQTCYKILQTYRQTMAMSNPSSAATEIPTNKDESLIALLIHDPDYSSDMERARDMVVYIFAGFETTAHCIAWTLLELARHPKEQESLRTALVQCSSQDEARACPPLKHVIRESLRLHSPAALGSVRQLDQEMIFSQDEHDYYKQRQKPRRIPAGSICIMPFWVILRNHNIFPNPDEFQPSRWEHATEEQLQSFFPFAVGRRNCQGQALANAELVVVLERLVSHYEFHVVDEGRPEYFVTWKTVGTKLAVKRILTLTSTASF